MQWFEHKCVHPKLKNIILVTEILGRGNTSVICDRLFTNMCHVVQLSFYTYITTEK